VVSPPVSGCEGNQMVVSYIPQILTDSIRKA